MPKVFPDLSEGQGRDCKTIRTYVVARDHAVDELQDAHDEQERHERIEQLDALRRVPQIRAVDVENDLLRV